MRALHQNLYFILKKWNPIKDNLYKKVVQGFEFQS